jgi:cysteine desulfurase family protein (TIGR01976 family)
VQHGASYHLSREAVEQTQKARQFVAEWIGASPDEVVFGASASQLFRMLALVLSADWEADDEVIVSEAEHEANAGCWDYLSQFGINVRIWDIDPDTLTFDLSQLTDMLNERTKLVAVHHSSNILGNIMPIQQIVNFAKSVGAYVCVDGVGHVPHRLVDVQDLGVDFYVFSHYKSYGPHIATLYGKGETLKKISKWNHFFFEDDRIPEKFELGAFSYELAAGINGLEKYFRAVAKMFTGSTREVLSTVYEDILEHETALTRDFLAYLQSKDRVSVVGDPDPRGATDRVPIISFMIDDADPEDLVRQVDEKKIGIRWGHFYAVRLLDAIDVLQYKGVIRVSLAHYNSETEMTRLKEVLDPLIS